MTFRDWNHQAAAAGYVTVVQGNARACWAEGNNAPVVGAGKRPDGDRLEACPVAQYCNGLQQHATTELHCLHDAQYTKPHTLCHKADDAPGIAQHRHAAPGLNDHRSARDPAQINNLLANKLERPVNEDCLLWQAELSGGLDGMKARAAL